MYVKRIQKKLQAPLRPVGKFELGYLFAFVWRASPFRCSLLRRPVVGGGSGHLFIFLIILVRQRTDILAAIVLVFSVPLYP